MSIQRLSLFQRLITAVTDLLAPRVAPVREDTDAQLQRLMDEYNRKVDLLTQGMEAGTVTVGQFVGSMPSLIKQHQLAVAVVAGGGADNANPQTLALAQQNVTAQLGYFEAWKQELLQQAARGELPSAAYIANRAKLYGKAANATAQQARLQAQGLPMLPFYPAQATQCRVNCKCTWDIRVLDVVNGNYDCYWTLGIAEHCPTCLARSRAANPLRVRRGVIQNAEKFADARFYA